MTILLDAGPSLNFLAVGQENILIKVAASQGLVLAVPARVDSEIVGMCKNARFAKTGAAGTWSKLKTAGRVTVMADELLEADFMSAVSRISGMPADQRIGIRRSLGEIMVLAHASVLAQHGHSVFVLMDDADGRDRARREYAWLHRRVVPGTLTLWMTRQVLMNADPAAIKGGHTWVTVYRQMMKFDDGLEPL